MRALLVLVVGRWVAGGGKVQALSQPNTAQSMSVIQQILDFAEVTAYRENYESLASVFILPTDQGFNQLAQELQGVSVNLTTRSNRHHPYIVCL
jgi:hypothetical protein